MDQFLDPETDANCQFLEKNLLDPETDVMEKFLGPETDVKDQFLNPETDIKHQFLVDLPETGIMDHFLYPETDIIVKQNYIKKTSKDGIMVKYAFKTYSIPFLNMDIL